LPGCVDPDRAARPGRGDETAMGFLSGVLQAIGMLVALGAIVVLLAALFMIVFQIATGIDDRLND
jgi:hypothetical protein